MKLAGVTERRPSQHALKSRIIFSTFLPGRSQPSPSLNDFIDSD